MRRVLLTLFILSFLLPSAACNKSKYKLTGTESDEAALEKCLALSKKKKFKESIECLEIFKSRFPDSTHAYDAELRIADNYFQNKEWLLAAESYSLFAKLHPSHPKLDYAYYRAGLAYEKLLPKTIDRDLTYLDKAEENFAMVFRGFPSSPYSQLAQEKYDQIRGRNAKKNMYVGTFYYKYGEYIAAIPRFLTVLQDYPGLGFDEDALYRLAFSYKKLGLNDKAQAAAQLMQEKFPQSKKTKKVVRKILGGKHGRNS
jgi:outer membrane protein assembly factor BamD